MNIRQLKSLIAQGESETLEFKTSTAQLKPACETLCGFLNAKGGIVLIGIGNKGQIIGQHITDNTHQEIANELRKIEPAVHISVNYVKVGDKQVIVMQAPAGKHIPYVYDGRPFERTLNSKGKMTQHHYEQLLIQRGQLNHSWEDTLARNYSIVDLDHQEIYRTVQDGIRVNRILPEAGRDNIEEILTRFELLKDGVLKNAAVVLFAKKLFPDYSQCLLKMGRFKGSSRTDSFIDNQQVYGNVFTLISAADHFIRRHLPIASFFESDQFERVDKPILPVLAVREAMVNAVCHRDYRDNSSSISLAIYDDRLEIWNNGTLPPGLKLSDLKKKHESRPRNKLIANVLYSRKFFERWGSGTIKMLDLCKEHGVPEPEFEEYSGGFSVTFKFKNPIGVDAKMPLIEPSQREITSRQKQILAILSQQGKMALREIRAFLESPPADRTIRDDLAQLKNLGFIDSEGMGRGARWFILRMGR
jgi:ATP-dependent DNA helicase RecG